jgi:hypothetical protein
VQGAGCYTFKRKDKVRGLRKGEHSESGPLLIHTPEIIAALDSNLRTTKKAEINSYLHGHIKCIASHPFQVGTSRYL